MNILYISNLKGNIASGLSWSVPASVKAQETIDHCLWVNLNDVEMLHWREVKCYNKLSTYGNSFSLSKLPEPFDHPDIVVFEGLYHVNYVTIAFELRKIQIPYIIIPRSSLTKQAINNKSKWKKLIAHFLFYNKFIHKAASIQYLTNDELRDSGTSWNANYFVLSNGFNKPEVVKESFNTDCIKAIFIGRLEMHQKGLDVLLDSIYSLRSELRASHFSLCLYGPNKYHYTHIEKFINDKEINDIVTLGGVITGKEKEQALLNSDLFVLTSRFEGHPMGLIEALSYGVPAIVTPGSNMANEITEADAGWSCNDVTIEELTNLIKRMLAEKDSFREKSKNAITLVQPYNWDVLAQRFHQEVVKILKS